MLNVLRQIYININIYIQRESIPYAEAALQRCSHENVPRKIPPNPQENTNAKVKLQQGRRAALLKSHSNAGAPPQTNS